MTLSRAGKRATSSEVTHDMATALGIAHETQDLGMILVADDDGGISLFGPFTDDNLHLRHSGTGGVNNLASQGLLTGPFPGEEYHGRE